MDQGNNDRLAYDYKYEEEFREFERCIEQDIYDKEHEVDNIHSSDDYDDDYDDDTIHLSYDYDNVAKIISIFDDDDDDIIHSSDDIIHSSDDTVNIINN